MHKKKLYYSFKIKTNDKDENMNEFAKLLSAFVKEKGVKIQPFARYCGYDRAADPAIDLKEYGCWLSNTIDDNFIQRGIKIQKPG